MAQLATEAPRLVRLPDDGPLAPRLPAPRLVEAPIVAAGRMTAEYWRLVLGAPEIAQTGQPGQFAMLTVPPAGELAPVLPRPMAIYAYDREAGTIEVAYRIVGDGTRRLTARQAGETMTIVGPLGRGFVLPPGARRIVLLGRGIGTCSLTSLAVEAGRRGIDVIAVASARHHGALVGAEVYRAAGASEVLEVVDADGSSDVGRLGSRLQAACAAGVDAVYACGSNRLLALGATLAAPHGAVVQVSLEAHMACGLGYCHGCATGHPGLAHESPLVCADGPVFRIAAGEIAADEAADAEAA